LGIGDWGLGPIPNPQSPIPNPQTPIKDFYKINNKINKKFYIIVLMNNLIKLIFINKKYILIV